MFPYKDFKSLQEELLQMKTAYEEEKQKRICLEQKLQECDPADQQHIVSSSAASTDPFLNAAAAYTENQMKKMKERCNTWDGDVYLKTDIGVSHNKNKKFMEVFSFTKYLIFLIHLIYILG